jgi:DNA-binding transcriptional LysR family regulator
MALTFRKLEVFVAVTEQGNFRKAAERLGISQPSVSSQIKSMERYLGYQLFERRRGATSELSVEGRNFLTRALDLVAAQTALTTGQSRRFRPQPVRLRVAAGAMLLDRRILPGLARFRETHPHIDLQFVRLAMGSANAVQQGEADVALCSGAEPESGDESAEVLTRVTCSLYGAPLLVRPVLQGQRELTKLPFLLFPEHYYFSQWAMEQFARKGINPIHFAARPPFVEMLMEMVLSGKGVGLIFDNEIAPQMRAGRVLPCGPVFDPVARIMITSELARTPDAAPFLTYLRSAIGSDGESIAMQQPRPARQGVLARDDNPTRISSM